MDELNLLDKSWIFLRCTQYILKGDTLQQASIKAVQDFSDWMVGV